MKSIVNPKIMVNSFWSIPEKEETAFRIMRYVIRIDYKERALLHNVVTGQLVEIDNDEKLVIDSLPTLYSEKMDALIDNYFLVPTDFDEHQKVQGIKVLLRRLDDVKSKTSINHYTILPTTACNAQCHYCFEKGITPITMSEQTAEEVVHFIVNHCDSQKLVYLTWFGGEPTIGSERISQICKGLQENGIQYRSSIITNGYLLDEQLIKIADELWHLKNLQISLDGTENTYNRIKNYVNAENSPFQKVMDNVGTAINHEINVDLRMNYDKNNYHEFLDLVDIVYERYKGNPHVGIRAHQINEHGCSDGSIIYRDEDWYDRKNVELNEYSRKKGLFRRKSELPCLNYAWCDAANNDFTVILPQGFLVSCPEQLGTDQIIGNIKDGITNSDRVNKWKQFADYDRCKDCAFFPACTKILNCAAKDKCCERLERYRRCKEAMLQQIKCN